LTKESDDNDSKVDRNQIPLSIVLEYKNTYSSKFDPSETVLGVMQKALHSAWHERTQPAEWKISDRYGRELPIYSKLRDLSIPRQDTLYLSMKLGDLEDENLLMQIEDKIEQKV
jgi:hypothetical protein